MLKLLKACVYLSLITFLSHVKSDDHSYGKSENILKFSNDSKVLILDDPLNKLFDHPDVKDRKIVAFSIIGAFRKGKSFFLDYCLRYLYAHYKSINYPENPISSPDDWMGERNESLKGFTWRSGSVRDTTGIIIWNDVFLHTDARTGEKIAIVIMDTQGLFDSETSPMDNSRIFALGTLISSIQVLNLFSIIQEDQLQYLQFATEFAKFAREDSHGTAGKPFQNLLFLIRDWANDGEYSFGLEGGKDYLEYILKIQPNKTEELKSVRQFIRSSFNDLGCALLPHPGKTVAGSKRNQTTPYNGNWGQMDEDFKEELERLINQLLSPDQLVLKKISGNNISAREYKEYVIEYFKLFQSDKLPQTKSIYETTVEKQMTILVNECVEKYRESIYKYEDQIANVDQIQAFHRLSRLEALEIFNTAKKMGNADHEEKYRKSLQDEFERNYKQWSNRSEKKIRELEAERERVRLAEEEKQRLLLEQKENEKREVERLAELEQLRLQKVINETEYSKEKAIADHKLKSEQEKTNFLEKQYNEQENLRKELDEKLIAIEKEKELEREKAMKAEQEKQKILSEQIESERKVAEQALELERMKAQKAIDDAKYKIEKEKLDERLKNEQEKIKLLKEQNDREEELQKKFNETFEKIEEEKRQAIDIYNPVYSSGDNFFCKYRFLAHNYIELRLTLSSAKGLVNALAKLSLYQFRTYYFAFIDRIAKQDSTGGGIMQSDYENILEKITSGDDKFISLVEKLERSSYLNQCAYVRSYRSYNYIDLNQADVFVIE